MSGLPLRSRSSYQLGEARGGTRGWDLRAQAFTRTPALGGTGVAAGPQAGGFRWHGRRSFRDGPLHLTRASSAAWACGPGLEARPSTIFPPTASARARRLTPLPGEANGPFQAGGHVVLIKREGRRRGEGADAAGCAREPGASRAQPRGRRGGGEREPEPKQQLVLAEGTRAQLEQQPRWPWPWGDHL